MAGSVRGWPSLRLGNWPPVFLWLPATLVAVALLLPLLYLAFRAVGAGETALQLLWRPRMLQILLRTLALMAAVTGASAALALPLAWLTVRADLPFRRFWGVALALPLALPSYVFAFVMVIALGPRGMLQQWLEPLLGVQRLPDIYGFWGSAVSLTLLSYPYCYMTLRAALWRLDPVLEESSHALGQGVKRTFARVTLPMLRPALASGSLLVALYVLSDFGVVSLLQYETFTWSIYLQYQSALDRTAGAVMALALVALALTVVALEAYSRGRARYYRATSGAPRPPNLVALRRWRWPALALCGAVALAALALPLAVLVWWVIRGVAAGEPLLLLWGAARNSLYASVLAAGCAVVAAVPVAVLATRYPSWFSKSLERVAYVGFALPGVVIALALVFFGANFARPLYQTITLLTLAYVILFLPTAVGAIRTSLQQIPPRTEDAARSLGRSPLKVFLTVTLPLLRPGVVSGAALVFLLTMKELPATLILSPLGFNTLATAIWSAASEAFFARAAAPALLLALASSLPLAFLMTRERN